MDYSKFRYYKGETECPFFHSDFSNEELPLCIDIHPKAYWWWAERMILEHFPKITDSMDIEHAIQCWIWKGEASREWALVFSYVTGEVPSQNGGELRYYKGENSCPFDSDDSITRDDWLIQYPKAYWWWTEKESARLAQERKGVEYAIIDWINRNWLTDNKKGYPYYSQIALVSSYVTGNAPSEP